MAMQECNPTLAVALYGRGDRQFVSVAFHMPPVMPRPRGHKLWGVGQSTTVLVFGFRATPSEDPQIYPHKTSKTAQ